MKNLFLKAAVVIAFLSVSCEKTPVSPILYIDVADSGITFNADGTGGCPVITVTTDQKSWDYTLAPEEGWLSVERGADGVTLELTAAPHTELAVPEAATLTFTAGKAQEITLTVKQLSKGETEMVAVGGGTFMMGTDAEDHLASPVHKVTLGDFQIGKYEVTQAQWFAVMGRTIEDQRDLLNPTIALYGVGDDRPIYYVSWDEVQEFISELNTATGKNYRLPTEAEWEYAARGGSKSKGYTFSGSDYEDDVMWFYANSDDTHPVGEKLPNELGVYDMSGNVWEWCSDWKGDYSAEDQVDPTGPATGTYRIYRGGAWCSLSLTGSPLWRNYAYPNYRYYGLGFRLVLVP